MSSFARYLHDLMGGKVEPATSGGFPVDRKELDRLFSKEEQEKMVRQGVLVRAVE